MGLRTFSHRNFDFVLVAALLAVLLAAFAPAASADDVWLGPAGDNWSVGTDWNLSHSPASVDVASFTSSSGANTNSNENTGGTIGGLTLASDYTATVTLSASLNLASASSISGGTLQIGSGITLSGSALTVSGGAINGSGTINNNITLNSGTISGSVVIRGTLTINGGTVGPNVVVCSQLVVTNLSDKGTGSLRAAIANATACGSSPTITFQNGVSGTMTLASTLNIGGSMTITGPGASLLAISGGGAVQVFNIASAGVSISGVTITNGSTTTAEGGGIANSGTLTLTSVVVSGNVSPTGGGGISNSGTLIVASSTISGNSCPAGGGGIDNVSAGSLTITGSTISGNSTTYHGGGILSTGASVSVSNSTFSGNTSSMGSGGGLSIVTGTATLSNVTISGNSAPEAGGLDAEIMPTLTNTIVAGNTAPLAADINGAVLPNSFNNLIGDNTNLGGISNGSNGNQVGTAATPLLANLSALGNYGGSTQTMPPQGNSPALGAGTITGAPLTDQRGFPRVVNSKIDIGAVQFQGVSLAATSGDGQSATVNTAFASPLLVTATENTSGVTVPGASVTFTVPSSGASAVAGSSPVTTNASGQASTSLTANAISGGPYSITASATSPDQATASAVSFSNETNLAATQSILGFGPISNVTFGAAPFNITGVSASSGLTPVTFGTTSVTVCQVSGTQVTIVGVGPCTITASQAGNTTFAPTSAQQSFSVLKATPTIGAIDAGGAYNGSAFPASCSVNGGSTLEGVGLTLAYYSGSTTIGPALVSVPSNAGTYTAQCNFTGSTDYSAASNTVTFVIGKVTLTVTANNATRVYGAANPTFTATITGFVGTDTQAGVLGATAPALTTAATTTSPAGLYTITAALGTLPASLGNYTYSFVSGTLTVNGSVLTVTAAGGPRPYGQTNPLTYSITGFINGDTIAVVTGAPSLTTTASTNSAPGTYSVTAAQGTLAATNYVFAFVPGTLTVTQAVSAMGANVAPLDTLAMGQTFTVTFFFAPTSAAPPSGTVTYSLDGGAPQTAAISNGTATATFSGLSIGVHRVVNSYGGDNNYLPSTATTIVLTVTGKSTQVALTVSPSATQSAGQAFTLTFTLAGTPPPTGSIMYTVDGGTAQSATISAGQAIVALNNLAVGSHTVSYGYSGDTNYGGIFGQTTTLTVTAAVPVINSGGVVGAAGVNVSLSPGGIGSIYGTNLAAGTASAAALPLPTMLSGVQVLVNGTPAPLFYVSSTQINFQVPYGTPVGTPVQVVVILNGASSLPAMVTVNAAAPAIFTYARTPTTTDPVILHANNTLVTPTSPAQPGEVLVIYATGAGTLNNTPANGAGAPASPLATTVATPVVTVGGLAGTVQFSGLTPGLVGLLQINVQLPAVLPSGTGTPPTLPVVVTFPNAPSAPVSLYVPK